MKEGRTMARDAGIHGGMKAMAARLAQWISDRRGVAAIEFALIVPLLLSMYFVTMKKRQSSVPPTSCTGTM